MKYCGALNVKITFISDGRQRNIPTILDMIRILSEQHLAFKKYISIIYDFLFFSVVAYGKKRKTTYGAVYIIVIIL